MKIDLMNCFLLVVILILLVVCCVNKHKENFANGECVAFNKETEKNRCRMYKCFSRNLPTAEEWVQCDSAYCTKDAIYDKKSYQKRVQECYDYDAESSTESNIFDDTNGDADTNNVAKTHTSVELNNVENTTMVLNPTQLNNVGISNKNIYNIPI
jgi:hypothetical protein